MIGQSQGGDGGSGGQGMERLFSEEELKRIDSDNPQGLSAQRIIELFRQRGVRLSEATFRKYIQLGLLPRSRRIGRKGKHKGSQGVYPTHTIRRINDIKDLMQKGMTIEELQKEFLFLGGEFDELEQSISKIIQRLESATSGYGISQQTALKIEINELRKNSELLLARIKRMSEKLMTRARLTKTAM